MRRTLFLEPPWWGQRSRRWHTWKTMNRPDIWNNLAALVASWMNAVNGEVWMEVTS